jgi:hypothetical protein
VIPDESGRAARDPPDDALPARRGGRSARRVAADLLALPLTRSQAATLPVLASSMRTEEGIQFGQLGVIAMVILLPVALFTGLARR